MSPVADDPTTKPCHDGRIYSLRMSGEHVYTHPPDCTCHGTGRVPMDTGELLEALARAVAPAVFSFSVFEHENGQVYGSAMLQSPSPIYEALSAALWAVTP